MLPWIKRLHDWAMHDFGPLFRNGPPPVPVRTTSAEIFWRQRTLGQLTLPVLDREEFCRQLSLQMPTLNVCLGEQTVACQTYVSGQSRGLSATALLSSPTSLVPLVD